MFLYLVLDILWACFVWGVEGPLSIFILPWLGYTQSIPIDSMAWRFIVYMLWYLKLSWRDQFSISMIIGGRIRSASVIMKVSHISLMGEWWQNIAMKMCPAWEPFSLSMLSLQTATEMELTRSSDLSDHTMFIMVLDVLLCSCHITGHRHAYTVSNNYLQHIYIYTFIFVYLAIFVSVLAVSSPDTDLRWLQFQ